MSNLITLTTDFGLGEYVAAMKGVILKVNSEARIIDISHMIRTHNINEGAYVLYSTASYFPYSIHVGVVDPGVGSKREGIIIECKFGILVGPDNGLLVPCARRLGLKSVYKITNTNYLEDTISDTFHGRDIFAPAAAYLSKGVQPSEIGEEWDGYCDLVLEYVEEKENSLKGKFLYVDRFGNLIFSIPRDVLSTNITFGDEVEIELRHGDMSIIRKMHFRPTYSHEKSGGLLATISSSGFMEIACNKGSAMGKLKMAPISEIIVRF
jgi:S-adenosylmethionine hydrolase